MRNPSIPDLVETDVMAMLSEVRKIYPDAFLAGGYLRDRLLEVEPKDVDIFTFLSITKEREGRLMQVSEASGGEDPRILYVEEHIGQMEMDAHLFSYPVQIIHFRQRKGEGEEGVSEVGTRAREEVANFMFGCQQIIWDVDHNVIDWTPTFERDVKNQTMTICRCIDEYDAYTAVNKWTELREKLQGWKLVVPQRYASVVGQHINFGPDVVQEE